MPTFAPAPLLPEPNHAETPYGPVFYNPRRLLAWRPGKKQGRREGTKEWDGIQQARGFGKLEAWN